MTGENSESTPSHPQTEKFANLKDFSGKSPALAGEFLEKFEIMSERKEWTGTDQLFYFKMLLCDRAHTWMKGLAAGEKDTFDNIKRKFKEDWIHSESRVVIENRLMSRKLEWRKQETIDEFRSAIVELGGRLGRTAENLSSDFLRGLPDKMRDYCLNSDNHTLASYVSRAKLYMASHAAEFVAGETPTVASAVNAVRDREYRARSPSCSRGQEVHSHDRGRPSSIRGGRGRGGRGRGGQSSGIQGIQCYQCHGFGHKAAQCRTVRHGTPGPSRGSNPRGRPYSAYQGYSQNSQQGVAPQGYQQTAYQGYPQQHEAQGQQVYQQGGWPGYQQQSGNRSGYHQKPLECWVCGENHMAKECPNRFRATNGPASLNA